jgi:hypothetical protein
MYQMAESFLPERNIARDVPSRLAHKLGFEWPSFAVLTKKYPIQARVLLETFRIIRRLTGRPSTDGAP